jgi:DNA-binding SARP family transcriptional activator
MNDAETASMRLSVLGPVQVWRGGEILDLGTPRQRSILAALALSLGRTVPLDTLVARVWGDRPPATAVSTLQRYVAALRRALEPERAAYDAPSVIVTDGGGYVLRIPRAGADVAALEQAAAEARTLLSGLPDPLRPQVPPGGEADAARAVEVIQDALSLWRGTPYADLGDDPEAGAERTRLEDVRAAASELRLVALMALGRHTEVVGELESMTALHPLHERWWGLHAVALVRSGRQAEALESLGTLRALLGDELGVEPSAPLRDLHTAILQQDPSLGWTAEAAAAPSAPPLASLEATEVAATSAVPSRPRWPLAGRAAELARLREILHQARQHRAGVVLIAGEAGVGKTRLTQELALTAAREAVTVVTVTCSQQSPPALWPLRRALTSLADRIASFPFDAGPLDTQPDEFGTRDLVADAVLRAASISPLLLVVEDVQWADAATLQVLETLMSRRGSTPLMLVLTRRTHSGDELEMTRLAATVARTAGDRIDLQGLTLDESRALVREIDSSVDVVDALWERSGGNPFFLAELARAGGELNGSLADVVLAHVRTLPAPTITALDAASALDVSFDVRLLARMLGEEDEEETVRILQAALDAGILVEEEDGSVTHAFTHAVLREVVYAEQTRAAVSRWHAAAARVLTAHGDLRRVDQRAGVAHHWARAGRGTAAEAWRGVVEAAASARSDAAYAEEARHLALAGRLQAQDPVAGDRERFEVLMLRANACRWGGDWGGLSDAVDEAIVVAERIGDHALVARAAISVAEGALRHVRPFGQVHRPIVAALERVLLRLGSDEQALRCRTQVALAMELYFDRHQTERIDKLVEEAVRFAEGSDDLRLRFTAYHGAFVATWRLDTVERRAVLAERALDVARRLDDPRALVFAETLVLGAASERGDAPRIVQDLDRVIQLAARRGLPAPEGVLRVLALGWASMRGDARGVAEQTSALAGLMSHARSFVATAGGTVVTAALLSGDLEALRSAVADFVPEDGFPTHLIGATLLIRFGDPGAARDLLRDVEVDLADHTFLGPLNAALACQVGAVLGATQLTADAYARLLPHAGRVCSAGAAASLGPVDLHLALGAAALGDLAAAERHLHEAEQLITRWPLSGLHHELAHVRDIVRTCAGRVPGASQRTPRTAPEPIRRI